MLTKVKTRKFGIETLLNKNLFARLIFKFFLETRENRFFKLNNEY